ncbi:MAG: phytanoyl-CoA dioxygenase family protein [Pikeienuella sp.]|uniref:phytanoyl-CoA dioxygenase family protein n=1 Tax=Pikeienuella sp. TaxID=2831957 RepID=UPI0039196139
MKNVTFEYADVQFDAAVRDEVKASIASAGIAILKGYFSPETCDALVGTIDRAIQERPEIVWRRSDLRIFGADVLAPEIEAFRRDSFLEEVGELAVGKTQRCVFSMANRLEMVAGQPRRSGGDWHRDRMSPQFKAMVYLTDVGPDNGPFSFFPGSNRVWPYGVYCKETKFDFFANRWTPDEFADFQEAAKANRLIVTAPKGSVVLFESSNIHSGLPITDGRRYAITNYYYAEDEIDIAKMTKKFMPCARPITMPDFSTRAA